MEMLKKFKPFYALGAAAVAFICIWICFGAGVTTSIGDATIYSMTFGDGCKAGVLVAWLFMLIGMLAAAAAGAMLLLHIEEKIATFVNLGAALFLLVAAILYFCTHAFSGVGQFGGLGVAAVFNGILLILAALAAGLAGALDFIK